MTQFALFDLLPNTQRCVPEILKPSPTQGMICKASFELFGPDKATYILELNGRAFDEIYVSAQTQILEGGNPEETGLLLILNKLKCMSKAIAMWYGDDYHKLPVTANWNEFILLLIRDLDQSPFGTSQFWINQPVPFENHNRA